MANPFRKRYLVDCGGLGCHFVLRRRALSFAESVGGRVIDLDSGEPISADS